MKKSYTFIVIIIVIFFTSLLSAQTEISRTASGKNGIVASGKAEGTSAGLRILEKGGTAADAAAASLLVLSIKHIGAFCIGGEVPIIIYDAKK
ncbi:MAG: gamma-glutamyltransferase, partial [Calditrichaeota bacterium]|nr:gamma-glutamyltransferase [Calditrichota bacterium]